MSIQGEQYLSLEDYQQYIPGRDSSLSEQISWTGHLHKYDWATAYLKGKGIGGAVLDLGCGGGFGSHKLAMLSRHVVGVDFNVEVLKHASLYYADACRTLAFCAADATELPFPSNDFAAVCSFEVIEHLPEHKLGRYLSEITRVLEPGGIVLFSTPNRAYRELTGAPMFAFHDREYTSDELLDLLQRYFNTVHMFGQRYLRAPIKALEQRMGYESMMRFKQLVPRRAKQAVATALRWDRDPLSNWTIGEEELDRAWGLLAACTVPTI